MKFYIAIISLYFFMLCVLTLEFDAWYILKLSPEDVNKLIWIPRNV